MTLAYQCGQTGDQSHAGTIAPEHHSACRLMKKRRSDDCVRLRDLGRGRRWAERAVHGSNVRIVNDEYEVVAHIVPATEPITPELIEWFVTRFPN